MGIVWDRAESAGFQGRLRENVAVWDTALAAWAAQIDRVGALIGEGWNGQLTGAAWNAVKSLFVDRVAPIVATGQNVCASLLVDLDAYAGAEAVLAGCDDHLEQDALQAALDSMVEEIAALRDAADKAATWLFPVTAWSLHASADSLEQTAAKVRGRLQALVDFNGRVSGLFESAGAARAAIAQALGSIGTGTLTADGVYAPPPGDQESWQHDLAVYNAANAGAKTALAGDLAAKFDASGRDPLSLTALDWQVIAANAGDPAFAAAFFDGVGEAGFTVLAGWAYHDQPLPGDPLPVGDPMPALSVVLGAASSSSAAGSAKVSAYVESALAGGQGGDAAHAVSWLLGAGGVFAVSCAVEIADWVVGASEDSPGPVGWSATDYPPVTALAMLANNPAAASVFFTGGGAGSGGVDSNVWWVYGQRGWPDGGVAAGKALFAASVPPPNGDGSSGSPSAAQARVASDMTRAAADLYAGLFDPGTQTSGYVMPLGLSQGTASVLAAYGPSVIEIANGQGGSRLSVTRDQLGVAVQALGVDPTSLGILVTAWPKTLPDYLRTQLNPGDADQTHDVNVQLRWESPKGPASDALDSAAVGLDFVVDNGAASWRAPAQAPLEAAKGAFVSSLFSTAVGEIPVVGFFWDAGEIVYSTVDAYDQAKAQQLAETNKQDVQSLTNAVKEQAGQVWADTLAKMGYDTTTFDNPDDHSPDDHAASLRRLSGDIVYGTGAGDWSNPRASSDHTPGGNSDRTVKMSG